jgi:hypothetical protein
VLLLLLLPPLLLPLRLLLLLLRSPTRGVGRWGLGIGTLNPCGSRVRIPLFCRRAAD